ncbi:amidohydrolase [Streptomyces macrosporus]|uniref:Amidohydrolase n=1 Tax=Streptomyces macrosporus TaxID=44032 RepID=A0ABN3JGN0_9ACTN
MPQRLHVNGKVFTGRGEDDFVSAFAVADGRVVWVGETADAPTDEHVERVDLEGRTVLPGFVDVHTHPSLVAGNLGAVACTPPHVGNIEEMVEALRRSPRAGRGEDVWIEGWGYDESKLAEGRTPTAADLDRVSTTQPVYVRRSDCHSGVCNTRALELAGITRDTPDPPGARFGRREDGEPDGVLMELAANDAVLAAKETRDHAHAVRELAGTAAHYDERGIVAVTDMMARREPYDHLDLYRGARESGMRQRVVLYYDWAALTAASDGTPPDLPASARTGDVRVGGLKLFMDGSISNRTAWTADPYPGSDDHGMRTLTDEAIRAAHAYARRNGLQLVFHAMGDRAIGHVIDLFADEEPWLEGVPSVRIDHATLMTDEHVRRIGAARMDFGVVTQIVFFFAEHDSYVRNLSPERYRRAYPLRSLYAGLDRLALSSDAPATTWADPDDVFTSVQAAVTRRAYNGADIVAEQALTVPQALLLYTGRARRLADLPGVGLIAPGYDASFVVLDRDVFTVPVEEIDRVRVAETHIRGEEVHRRG